MEIRDFGYVDNIVVLGRNLHDVTLFSRTANVRFSLFSLF